MSTPRYFCVWREPEYTPSDGEHDLLFFTSANGFEPSEASQIADLEVGDSTDIGALHLTRIE